MIVNVTGTRPPAPIPCRARNPISCPMLWAVPDNMEPAKNSSELMTNTGLRPYRSLILPKIGVVTDIVSR
ncbi:hypothetical protein D3C74_233780 [compost metagenome]